MKLTKKKVLVSALVISLVAILSMGTLAWFTDTDEVENEFKVAVSTEDADDIFSIDVRELVDTNDDGIGDTVYDADDNEGGFTYENIVPGDSLYKKPYVRNTGAYDQWVRVKVTIGEAAAWKQIFTDCGLTDIAAVFGGFDDTLWTRYDAPTEDTQADTITYTFYLNEILVPGAERSLFTHVNIPEGVTRDHAAALAGGNFTVKVVAEAIQAEHTGTTATEAFTKF